MKYMKKTIKSFGSALYILIPTILLIALFVSAVPPKELVKLFSGNRITDSLIGSIAGSVSAGNPIVSYIIGGELLKNGIGLIAVTAFLVAWVTVGVIQFPAESKLLGRKFAIWRNITAFILSIIIAITTYILVITL